MTRDPLDLLRSANPVPQPVTYSEDDQSRRIADILDRDGDRPLSLGSATPGRRSGPRWLSTGLAAAAVILLAVGLAVLLTRRSDNNVAAGARPVTCTVAASGGSNAVSGRLAQAEVAISERVHQLGGSARSFALDSTEADIGFTPHGISIAKAVQACRASTVAVRPVISRPSSVNLRGPRSPAPLSALRFSVPASDAAYTRLTAAQKAQLAAAMSHYDCSPLRATTTVGLACSASTTASAQVFLVGSPIVRGSDVHTARAQAPDPGAGGSAEWTVQLSLRAAGAARLRAFSASHHTDSSIATPSTCGTNGPAVCADFLAFTINGRAESVPETNAVLDSAVSISGAFDQAGAQALAADITAASVQLHPR